MSKCFLGTLIYFISLYLSFAQQPACADSLPPKLKMTYDVKLSCTNQLDQIVIIDTLELGHIAVHEIASLDVTYKDFQRQLGKARDQLTALFLIQLTANGENKFLFRISNQFKRHKE